MQVEVDAEAASVAVLCVGLTFRSCRRERRACGVSLGRLSLGTAQAMVTPTFESIRALQYLTCLSGSLEGRKNHYPNRECFGSLSRLLLFAH